MLEDRDFTLQSMSLGSREVGGHIFKQTQTTIGKMLDDAMDLVEDEQIPERSSS